jgi:hypothetical protein
MISFLARTSVERKISGAWDRKRLKYRRERQYSSSPKVWIRFEYGRFLAM